MEERRWRIEHDLKIDRWQHFSRLAIHSDEWVRVYGGLSTQLEFTLECCYMNHYRLFL